MICSKTYLSIHDRICTYTHLAVLKDLGKSVEDSWLHQKSQELTICGNITEMYDMSIITNRRVLNNKTYLIIWNKEKRNGLFVYAVVTMDRNCVKMYAEKLRNYRKLEIETQNGWNMQKVKTIFIIVVAIRKICEVPQENLEKISP